MLSFPRFVNREVRPWLRLFEELESSTPHHHNAFRSQLSSFTPSFDIRETKDSYVLDGELPGVTDKSALDLTFVDENTLVIKGRVERNNETGKPSTTTEEAATETTATKYHAPTVEEEGGESSAVTKTSGTSTEVEKQDNGEKYWIRERYVGEFQRAFNFPQSVDHDAVKASLKDGILSIVVPKKTKPEGFRKINIE